MVPFINLPWCNSKECEYEFKIALRNNLSSRGVPHILPILLERSSAYGEYPFSLSPLKYFFFFLSRLDFLQ